MLFRKALFLATTFPKIVQNSIFLLLFYQNFPTICLFRPNVRKCNAGLLNVLKNMLKMHFCYFLKRSFENFRNSSGVRQGAEPRAPYEADPLKCSPEPKSWGHRCISKTGLKHERQKEISRCSMAGKPEKIYCASIFPIVLFILPHSKGFTLSCPVESRPPNELILARGGGDGSRSP